MLKIANEVTDDIINSTEYYIKHINRDTGMLVLRTSNFQGTAIRPIVPRHKHSIAGLSVGF